MAEQCKAKSRQTGVQCKRGASPGFEVCYYHGAGGGKRTIKNYRYTSALLNNPVLRRHFEAIFKEGADDFDCSPEIVLLRARLAASLEEETVDIRVLNDIHRDLIRAVQKNTELQIKRQGLIQRSDAEKMLRAAVKVIVGYVPASMKAACFEELGRVLSGSLFSAEAPPQLAEASVVEVKD